MSEQPAASTEAPAASNPFAALGAANGQTNAFSGGFSFGVAAPAFAAPAKNADEEGDDGDDGDAAAEEECQAEYKPIVQLEEVETSTGEEEETPLFECKTKLFRYDPDSGEWKERGVGQAKILQHKDNKKVRMLMRQEKTLKIRANHLLIPGTKIEPHAGSDKAWVWSAVDFAEGEQKAELFCLKFGTVEKTQEFKKQYEAGMAINAGLFAAPAVKGPSESEKAADELAAGVEAVAVAEGTASS